MKRAQHLALTLWQADAAAAVLAILGTAGDAVPAASEGDIAAVILDRTPFYAESGGQHADAGTLNHATGWGRSKR